jgi:predicted Rossmann fold nucleotide-binding protein DprA/Smf involved in DNA uptake
MDQTVSPDTQATLLLVARLGKSPSVPPLNRREYIVLAQELHRQGLRPSDLLTSNAVGRLELSLKTIGRQRLSALLGRAGALGLMLESWENQGIWVVSRGDRDYPTSIRKKLRSEAPPVFFGIGPRNHLQRESIGVVGSRDLDEAGMQFAQRTGRLLAEQQLQVVSGAARGADTAAMLSAIESEGSAVGVMPGDLGKEAMSRQMRGPIRDGRLTLISSFEPAAHFTVSAAMERNKYIYALSKFVVVVASKSGKGGTWAGAVENLRHFWSPLVVRADHDAPEGNFRLLHHGGVPLKMDDLLAHTDLRKFASSLVRQLEARKGASESLELTFDHVSDNDSTGAQMYGVPNSAEVEGEWLKDQRLKNDAVQYASKRIGPTESPPMDAIGSEVVRGDLESSSGLDVFELLWPHLHRTLAEPRSLAELRSMFPDVIESQLKSWLSKAIKLGRVQKKGRPVRYRLSPAG